MPFKDKEARKKWVNQYHKVRRSIYRLSHPDGRKKNGKNQPRQVDGRFVEENQIQSKENQSEN